MLELPKPVSVVPFIVPVDEKTYSQILADTLGNAGTPSDGFDGAFVELAALTSAVAPIADFDPADVQGVSDGAAAFGAADEGDLALALQPASDATDAALSDYGTVVPPTANPTDPVGGPTKTPPTPPGPARCTPPTAADFPGQTLTYFDCFQDVALGSKAVVKWLANILTGLPPVSNGITGRLVSGDRAVWSVDALLTTTLPNSAPDTLYVTVHPVKRGTFLAVVRIHWGLGQTDSVIGYSVRVV